MSGYISVPRQAGGQLKHGILDILVQWSGGEIGGGVAYERIVAFASRSIAPPTEPPGTTVADVVGEYLTAKDAEIARLRDALEVARTALRDWAATYAPDMCAEVDVKESGDRIGPRGTFKYIASAQRIVISALKEDT